jgi:outer membrane immunogenic protein
LKKFLMGAVAALSLVACASSSQAADLMDMPVGHDWSGFYLGATFGYGFGDNNFSERSIPANSSSGDLDGALFGATMGYNFDLGTGFLLGLEADFSASTINSSAASGTGVPFFNCGGGRGCIADVENLATVRARVGYLVDNNLFYATGGLAVGDATAKFDQNAFNSGSDTLVGWTAGGGVEHAFTERLTGKIEYLYVDLGRLEIPVLCNANCFTDVNFSVVRAGFNYNF